MRNAESGKLLMIMDNIHNIPATNLVRGNDCHHDFKNRLELPTYRLLCSSNINNKKIYEYNYI